MARLDVIAIGHSSADLCGALDAAAAVATMAERFYWLCPLRDRARAKVQERNGDAP